MCVDPVLSVPDSSAPSPPGPSGSGLFARQGGPTRVGPFLFESICLCRDASASTDFFLISENTPSPHPEEPRSGVSKDQGRATSAGPAWFEKALMRLLTMRIESVLESKDSKCARVSAATYTPRPASGPAFPGCRP